MKNRMQDLDFEQNVAFDKVQEYEFTRRAAQRFRQVVSLDSFEDEDADVIFHYLYKEMELVSFGDHLKRYIYERAELEEPFSEVPQEVYKEIVVDSFKETYTPKSMNPTSTKLSALVNNWLNQASVFSAWEMVPRMIGALVSYEAERLTVGKLVHQIKNQDKKNTGYFADGSRRYPVARLRFNVSNGEVRGMSLFAQIGRASCRERV